MKTRTHLWLRAEAKPLERRTALMPAHVSQLLAAGIQVTVERCGQRIVEDDHYRETGCHMAATHAWKTSAPSDAFILGLKELSNDQTPLSHRHIHFAHVYKEQSGWQATLQRYADGGGTLYDLEYLVNEQGRRVAAFGHWAGFVGAGLALLSWARQMKTPSDARLLPALEPFRCEAELVENVRSSLQGCARMPSTMIIGALGRSGRGATELCEAVGAPTTRWDLAETSAGGPFPETIKHDVLVNCVFVQSSTPPFLTTEMLTASNSSNGELGLRKLSVICDVSCDPLADYNPLPIYDACTSIDAPTVRLSATVPPVDLIAIDHLPSLLPLESSEDFGNQLLPFLLALDRPNVGVWAGAESVFDRKVKLASAPTRS